jgi:hypothetical protein
VADIETFNKGKYFSRAAKGFTGSANDGLLLKNPDATTT